ncbi:uncharacterized protein FIESC28_09511 [Fusarium coffeatum]|uniref:Uncharacterized protein n=1 Tax=Fusarium coffeatum TaxID=231269 RepID=A0A366QZH8_9HYPO|nr:uncharacterized protein FIESC28_09511 [Fusarium coffeatum]RBR10303.1 hypothetical protein FIESC28_09511 [Fusarium coffeatum]
MKYSTTTLLILAQGITAAPSLLSQFRHKNANVKVPDSAEDITLSIKVSQSPIEKMHHGGKWDICWLMCWPEEHQCPETWYSKKEV